jgi:CDP-diacylglycerol---glycerol-3-phosphate 3-phosphatidyltransferase
MVSTRFADKFRGRIGAVGRIVAKTNISPNALTFIGLGLNIIVAAIIASGNLVLGGVLLLIAGGWDALDGAVARASNQITRFGAFLDSTFDRYSDAVVLGGVLIYFTRTDAGTLPIVLTYTALAGSLIISYIRAKSELIGIRGTVGFAQRLERVLILAAALLFSRPEWGIWVLAILTQITAAHRLIHVWRVMKSDPGSP